MLAGDVHMRLEILKCGSCEALKAGVHATALGLAAVMGIYNAAAWLRRREHHLAVNAVLYAALAAWEQKHVAHHMEARRRPGPQPAEPLVVTERTREPARRVNVAA